MTPYETLSVPSYATPEQKGNSVTTQFFASEHGEWLAKEWKLHAIHFHPYQLPPSLYTLLIAFGRFLLRGIGKRPFLPRLCHLLNCSWLCGLGPMREDGRPHAGSQDCHEQEHHRNAFEFAQEHGIEHSCRENSHLGRD